ncbi:hypothetical protein CDAR_619211 [Caerostris darwini]|uniref:Uncharacterized protein n=1 Tax=Caerostris darwini TaxID=1538125 RepID=A0AAV4U2Q5_9ARAC|nr:hypothetical protein CDAR_619211 [Caerostris darwini]
MITEVVGRSFQQKEKGGASAINIRKFLLPKSFTRSHTGGKSKGSSPPTNGSVLESRVITASPYLLLPANCSFLAASTRLRIKIESEGDIRKERGGALAINIRKFLLPKSFARSHTGGKSKGSSPPANGSVLESRVITATPYLAALQIAPSLLHRPD